MLTQGLMDIWQRLYILTDRRLHHLALVKQIVLAYGSPKDVSGLTFGTNGFHIDGRNASALGQDEAGSNDFADKWN